MRFDDSLDTVLAAGIAGPAAVQSSWRQVVDLIGRRRAPPRPEALSLLRTIRNEVPAETRLATARGLERADPPAALVAIFADEEVAIAAPVVRAARLSGAEWTALLPDMRPATRGVLRLRRDLPDDAAAALAAFGPSDLALGGGRAGADTGDAALKTPLAEDDFAIAGLVARIEAHRRSAASPPAAAGRPESLPESFRFETDAQGLIRWVAGIVREPLIGLSLWAGRDGAPVNVDAAVAGAVGSRQRFTDARLEVVGSSAAGGSWRISGVPVFDQASGRFTGYRGTARRPRADEAPRSPASSGVADTLRQLVHELRTPANAISGVAEMIEHQLLGPVPDVHRERAAAIRTQAAGLLQAIDDLDWAARLETRRLDLRTGGADLTEMLARVLADLAPLAELRGTRVTVDVAPDAIVAGDARAVERVFARLLAAIVAAVTTTPVIRGAIVRDGDQVILTVTRPKGFVAVDGGLFDAGEEAAAGETGAVAPLLGTQFAFRLAQRLAAELGGAIVVGPRRLTLRLPAVVDHQVGQATV